MNCATLRTLIQQARNANEPTATLDGWVIGWHYVQRLRKFLEMKNVPLVPLQQRFEVEIPVEKKHRDGNDDTFAKLCARLNVLGVDSFLKAHAK